MLLGVYWFIANHHGHRGRDREKEWRMWMCPRLAISQWEKALPLIRIFVYVKLIKDLARRGTTRHKEDVRGMRGSREKWTFILKVTSVKIKKNFRRNSSAGIIPFVEQESINIYCPSDLIRVVKYVQIKRLIFGEEEEATKKHKNLLLIFKFNFLWIFFISHY